LAQAPQCSRATQGARVRAPFFRRAGGGELNIMPLISEGASAVASGVAWGAYKYNRANYLYDQGMRYGRYVAGYSMAIEQATMYREDIRDLTAITISKQDTYHIVGVIFYVITFQLIMAGRLGVHGPTPPGWLMGIHYTVCGLAMMFLTLSTWLAMHASARATSGMAHMLTRTVRLPIPTPGQLDKARAVGNSYEHTRLDDMFRVPFAMPAGQRKDAFEDEESKPLKGKKGSSSSKHREEEQPTKKRRAPKWYVDESENLYGGSDACPTTPEHFELYRGLQQEWWCHDIYARISLLYYMSSWLHGAAFYIQSHAFGELRAIWVAWACTFPFVAAHYCILKMDILSDATKDRAHSFPVENIAPLTPILTVLGMSFEYSILEPSAGIKALIYVIAWTAYAIHFAWALRMYDIAYPVSMVERAEVASQPWWPSEWWLPPAFQHALYLVAAPKKVDDDQSCLQQEMKMAKGGGQFGKPMKKARETLPGLYPWIIMRGALRVMIGMWVFMIFGRIIEQLHGERFFLKQEGRVERWPSHMQPWMPPWTRQNGIGNPRRDEWCHTGGCDRRLSEAQSQDQRIAAVAQKLSAVLAAVSETLDHELAGPQQVAPVASAPLRQAKVAWPVQLRPTVLACGNAGAMAALARDGRVGITMRLAEPQQSIDIDTQPSPFSLSGVDHLGHVLGASWGNAGLLLATASGSLAECRGMPPASAATPWGCAEVGIKLPTGGSALKWAAAGRMTGSGKLRAAVVFEEDEAFTLFEESADGWEPAGEMRLPVLPGGDAASFSLSMSPGADELLITSAHDGRVIRMALSGTFHVAATPHGSAGTHDLVWRGTCGFGGGQLAHLASRWSAGIGAEANFVPELFISTRA